MHNCQNLGGDLKEGRNIVFYELTIYPLFTYNIINIINQLLRGGNFLILRYRTEIVGIDSKCQEIYFQAEILDFYILEVFCCQIWDNA